MYEVKVKTTKQMKKDFGIEEKYHWKRLLNNCSGYVNSGEAMFIMGSSGAGKTTMLNAMCD